MFARVMSALILFVTSACSARQPDARGTDLTLHCGAGGSLVAITLNDERIDLSSGENVDAFVSRMLGKVQEPVHVIRQADAPYRCIGGAIFTLQRTGVRDVGFLAESQEKKDAR